MMFGHSLRECNHPHVYTTTNLFGLVVLVIIKVLIEQEG